MAAVVVLIAVVRTDLSTAGWFLVRADPHTKRKFLNTGIGNRSVATGIPRRGQEAAVRI